MYALPLFTLCAFALVLQAEILLVLPDGGLVLSEIQRLLKPLGEVEVVEIGLLPLTIFPGIKCSVSYPRGSRFSLHPLPPGFLDLDFDGRLEVGGVFLYD